MMSIFSKYLNKISDLVFPHVCIGCEQEIIRSDQVLCIDCLIDLPTTDQFDFADNAFTLHFWGRVNISDGAALMIYNPKEITQKIIHNYKYRKRIKAGIILGKMIGDRINNSDNFNHIDYIIPVPLTKKRMYERGFNQSLILAQAIGEVTKWPVLDNVLTRAKDTSTQTQKGRVDRIENMIGAFKSNKIDQIKNKHILLVDDVMTTGATLEACALELAAHVSAISMVTLALGK